MTASGAALAGAVAVTMLAAGSADATTTTLSALQSTRVADGAYTVQNDEWGSRAPESITTRGNVGFTVASSSIDTATNGAPGGYPSIYEGCHWGSCTRGGLAANPVHVSTLMKPGTVTTSWSTTQPGGGAAYDAAYDIWFNQTPTTTGQPNGAELMVWLNYHGPVQPSGSQVGTATIDGARYRVWEGAQSWGDTVSYVMASPATSVRNLDVGALTADAVSRGYVQKSWYLIDVEAGFELWQGGAGLATNSFSVNLNGGSRSPAPAPSPASTFNISQQAISPEPTTPGIATNATVNFKNTGSTVASNVTLVIEILNKSGTVVGSQSWDGKNVVAQQALNETYTWTAAASTGNYTVEGLVQNSSGQVLRHANVGTIAVKPITVN